MCKNKINCPPGQYVVDDGNNNENRTCGSCSEGTYSDMQNTQKCTDKKKTCPAGEYFTPFNDQTVDNTCTVCPGNQFKTGKNSDKTCTDWTECNKTTQYEIEAPTATSDRVCKALTTCNDNEYETEAPTATSDRVCTEKTTECQGDNKVLITPDDKSKNNRCVDKCVVFDSQSMDGMNLPRCKLDVDPNQINCINIEDSVINIANNCTNIKKDDDMLNGKKGISTSAMENCTGASIRDNNKEELNICIIPPRSDLEQSIIWGENKIGGAVYQNSIDVTKPCKPCKYDSSIDLSDENQPCPVKFEKWNNYKNWSARNPDPDKPENKCWYNQNFLPKIDHQGGNKPI